MTPLKTSRGEDRQVETLAMANCLKLLSRVSPSVNLDGRVYACKICSKQFQSSQALGGHCARHKIPQLKLKNKGFKRHGSAKEGLKNLPAVVLKRSNSKRIFCLDLNLTPYENYLKMGLQMSSPILNY